MIFECLFFTLKTFRIHLLGLWIFLADFLQFSTQIIVSLANGEFYFSFPALTQGCEQDLCLFLILEEKHSVSRSIMLGCRYFRCSLSSGGSLPISFFFFLQVFIMKRCWNFLKCFSCIAWYNQVGFLLYPVNMSDNINFQILNYFFIPGINYICTVLFTHCIIVFVNILLRILRYWSFIFFYTISLVWYEGYSSFVKWFGKCILFYILGGDCIKFL